ncbi:MAG: hypothetical protein QM820_23195 [Minicystis sp.]
MRRAAPKLSRASATLGAFEILHAAGARQAEELAVAGVREAQALDEDGAAEGADAIAERLGGDAGEAEIGLVPLQLVRQEDEREAVGVEFGEERARLFGLRGAVGELGEAGEPVVERVPATIERAIGLGHGDRIGRGGEARGGRGAEGGEVVAQRVLGAADRLRQLALGAGGLDEPLAQRHRGDGVEARELDEVVGEGAFRDGHESLTRGWAARPRRRGGSPRTRRSP